MGSLYSHFHLAVRHNIATTVANLQPLNGHLPFTLLNMAQRANDFFFTEVTSFCPYEQSAGSFVFLGSRHTAPRNPHHPVA